MIELKTDRPISMVSLRLWSQTDQNLFGRMMMESHPCDDRWWYKWNKLNSYIGAPAQTYINQIITLHDKNNRVCSHQPSSTMETLNHIYLRRPIWANIITILDIDIWYFTDTRQCVYHC